MKVIRVMDMAVVYEWVTVVPDQTQGFRGWVRVGDRARHADDLTLPWVCTQPSYRLTS